MKKGDKKFNQKDTETKKKSLPAVIIAEEFQVLGIIPYIQIFAECALEKTIQTIERSSVKEIYVISHQKEKITSFFAHRKRENKNIKLLINEKLTSFGDVMRFIYEQKIVEDSFVLMYGNVITDFSINKLIETFEDSHEKNTTTLMLKVFHRQENFSRTLISERDVVIYDPVRMVIKGFESVKLNSKKNSVRFKEGPKLMFKRLIDQEKTQESLNLGFDLTESGIALCTADVINYYHEHFDFHHEKEQFFKDIINSEINDFTVGIYIVDDSVFMKRLENPFDCSRTSQLLLKNCMKFFYINKNEYVLSRFNKIVANSTKIHIKAVIGNTCFIGMACKIEEGVTIENSTILANCLIGQNSVLKNCFLSDGVQVPENSIWEGVIVLDAKKKMFSETVLRNKWIVSDEFKDVECETENSSDGDDSLFDESEEEEMNKNEIFQKEIQEIFERNTPDETQINNVLKELMNARLAGHIDPVEASVFIFEGILKTINFFESNTKGILTQFSLWRNVMEKFIRQETDIMLSVIERIAQFCLHGKESKFNIILQVLVKLEILTPEAVIDWHDFHLKEEQSVLASNEETQKFIDWLRPADEDESQEAED